MCSIQVYWDTLCTSLSVHAFAPDSCHGYKRIEKNNIAVVTFDIPFYLGQIFHSLCSCRLHLMLNALYTGRLFHCYILDKSICNLMGVRSILSLLF